MISYKTIAIIKFLLSSRDSSLSQLCNRSITAQEAIKKLQGKIGKAEGVSWTAEETGETARKYFGNQLSVATASHGNT